MQEAIRKNKEDLEVILFGPPFANLKLVLLIENPKTTFGG